MKISRSLVAFVACLFFSVPAAAKLYKWVDDQGTTHYGETIPPEYANKDRTELNKTGRTVKTNVLTPDELRAKEKEDAEKRASEKAVQEQKRHDQTLTSTYSNSKEVDLARSRSLQQVDARINSMNTQIKMASGNVLGLQNEAAGYTKANKPVPASLKEDLDDAQSRLDKLQQTLDKLKAEKAAVEARFDADKARYHELTGK